MNLYVRYFDHEFLAKTIDEALDFIGTIGEIKLDGNAANRISTFLNSSNIYPFRLKVSYSNYVLFLKTEAETLEKFREEVALRKDQKAEKTNFMAERKKNILEALNEEKVGWWEAGMLFKRVVIAPETGKCKYIDTRFRVRLKANSAMDAYNRILDHLQNRPDIDPRSQFPSVKSQNFEYKFLGSSANEANNHEPLNDEP